MFPSQPRTLRVGEGPCVCVYGQGGAPEGATELLRESRPCGVIRIQVSEAKYRDDFVDGLVDYAKDMKRACEKKGSKIGEISDDNEFALVPYYQRFETAVMAVHESEKRAKVKRTMALTTCGVALAVLIMFLVIALLIQIEENTRKKV